MKGVVDSADLPLNISRETMQDSALVRKLGSVISKRVIKMFEKEAEADPEKYRGFYKKFDRFFKEGVATDYREPRRAGEAAALRVVADRSRRVCRLRRLRLPHEGRAGDDLLPGRRAAASRSRAAPTSRPSRRAGWKSSTSPMPSTNTSSSRSASSMARSSSPSATAAWISKTATRKARRCREEETDRALRVPQGRTRRPRDRGGQRQAAGRQPGHRAGPARTA